MNASRGGFDVATVLAAQCGERELLGLWWLAEHGRLDRADLAAALGVPQNQAAVRIQRMKQQLSASRVVVRALRAPERCRDLSADRIVFGVTPPGVAARAGGMASGPAR